MREDKNNDKRLEGMRSDDKGDRICEVIDDRR
jgi:hypothetical protein